MKKLVFILVILSAIAFLAFQAQAIIFISGTSAAAGACSTPDNGNLYDEGFVGAGYEEVTFSETLGGSGTVDEDYDISGTSPPADACSEGAEIYAIAADTFISYDHGSTIDSTTGTTLFYNIYIPSASFSMDTWSTMMIVNDMIYNDFVSDDPAAFIKIAQAGAGSYTYRIIGTNNAGTVTFDSWETLELHIDSGTDASWFKLNGGSAQTFTQQGGKNKRYAKIGFGAGIGSGETMTMYVGYAYGNTTE